jgi:hypothetical protein
MNKSFDCVNVARAVKNQIEEQDRALDWVAHSQKTRQVVEAGTLWAHLKDQVNVVTPRRRRQVV